MPSKYLTSPLIIICVLAFFSVVGLGVGALGGFNMQVASFSNLTINGFTTPYLYTVDGLPKVYTNNYTAVAESGEIFQEYVLVNSIISYQTKYAGWRNSTGTYQLYNSPVAHAEENQVLWTSFNLGNSPTKVNSVSSSGQSSILQNVNFDIGALISVIAVVITIACLIGAQVIGSSASNDTTSAFILKAGAFLGLWGIFSGVSYSLLVYIPLNFGIYLYLFLTFIYVVGLIDTIGYPSK